MNETRKMPVPTTAVEAWATADWLASEAYRLGQAGDGAHTDTMLDALRHEIRGLALLQAGVRGQA